MKNQKEATFSAICIVTGHKDGVCKPTPEQRKEVNAMLLAGFQRGEISYDGDFNTIPEADQKSYVSGLQSNWLRKDKRLNGNVVYMAKNPGSRAGSGDAQLKSLKALFSTLTKDEDKKEVQGYIDTRTAEIAKTKQVATVDVSALPAELQAKYGHKE
jgi:hypothetical protein